MSKLKTTLLAWPAVTVAAILLCLATEKVAMTLFGVELKPQTSVDQIKPLLTGLFEQLSNCNRPDKAFFKCLGSISYIIAWICLIMPALEEFIFRYLLWRLPRAKAPAVMAVISSVLFTAAHYIQMPWPDNAFMALFFFALAQCYLYAKTGALWCPVLLHALFNMANMILMFFIPS